MQYAAPPSQVRRNWVLSVGVLVLMCILCIFTAGCSQDNAEKGGPVETQAGDTAGNNEASKSSDKSRLADVKIAIARGNLVQANELIKQQLISKPDDWQAMEMAGDVALRLGKQNDAADFYRGSIDQQPQPAPELLDKLAQLRMQQGRAFDTLRVLKEATEKHPDVPQFKFDLSGLSAMLGVPRVSTPSLIWLAQRGQADAESWAMLADPSRAQPDDKMCGELLKRFPGDLRPQYSLSLIDASKMRWDEVEKKLAPVIKKHPDFVPAYALYGRALVELGDTKKILAWKDSLPANIDESPTYWLAAGLWARNQKKPAQAARAFWEAVRRDESGQDEALNHLLLALGQLNRQKDADVVADKIDHFSVMRDALMTFLERDSTSQKAAMSVAVAMGNLGRAWEAEGWARFAMGLPKEKMADAKQVYKSIRQKMTVKTPWQLPETLIGNQLDLSTLPDVSWSDQGSNSVAKTDGLPLDSFRLDDQAKQRGLEFTCAIDPMAENDGHWIYQSVGSGVGVLDFDLDGWPDLALTMLDGKPMQVDSSPNALFRNLEGKFVEIKSSNYEDRGFAQGLCIADFNEDGFPDIYDTNIGSNRLYQNNGDGTFTDVTDRSGISGQQWSTSAVIADIDGDGNADLFEIAYCSGNEPYTRLCENGDKVSTCQPLVFNADTDRIYRGVGDGTFQEVTDEWIDQQTPGRGLGIIAGFLDERSGMDLYVANDMTVNHLWSSGASPDSPDDFQLRDLAAIRGLAFNARSLSQASMGMAAGDPDQDGDIDFFLTHFSDDYNTYYEQVSPGLWSDRTSQVGLSLPSMDMLGFGTEWIDLDNDGSLELMVTNGDVNSVSVDGGSPKMPAQLFHRQGNGRWVENESAKLGDYFQQEFIGRAMVPLDANRDGRADVLITHLYDPVALLINETPRVLDEKTTGNSIGILLAATRTHRDAIGAKVTLYTGDKTTAAQLTAGDGYMCSNQRRLSFGLGTAEKVDRIQVKWPSGTTETFKAIEIGGDYVLTEGINQAFRIFDHEK